MVLRITGGRPATKPIMMMVQALRPKITRNSGYISTVGADAMAATQVSVAWRSRLTRYSSTPSATPTTVIITPAVRASRKVRRNRSPRSSSVMTRPNASAICDGSGTMKRLMTPMRISTSTARIATTRVPKPSAGGAARERAHGGGGHDPCSLPCSARFSSSRMPRLASSRRSLQICAT